MRLLDVVPTFQSRASLLPVASNLARDKSRNVSVRLSIPRDPNQVEIEKMEEKT
jgi:hypothetical protein